MTTPHISAGPGDFAEAVLLPGDPLRAAYIAERFLDDARKVTAVRNMLGFTGAYRGMPVSALGSGMGMPSASIYYTELMRKFDVRRLIRVGSCGAVAADLALRDVILATGACTDSGMNRRRYGGFDFAAVADFGLLRAAADAATAAGIPVRPGLVHSSDLFYGPDDGMEETMERMGVLAVEMEAAGLYAAAAEEGRRALTILTVSDIPGHKATATEREQSFDEMITIALDALRMDAA